MADLITEGEVVFDTGGVFYNPRMKLNRDIGVAVTRVLGIEDYLDALSASGVRGLRVAKEAGVKRVVMNDVNPEACERIRENIERNSLSNCEASCSNANVIMHQRHFQTVDLDPFGSPSPFISAASRSALAYLFITATDTAPLCGAHLKSGIRKYMAVPFRADYHREMGARILLGLAARELARLDKAMDPLLTHATQHYVRTYLRVRHGAGAADRTLEKMGYIEHCQGCGSFISMTEPRPAGVCKACGCRTILAGPMWLGRLHDRDLVKGALAEMEEGLAARLLAACAAEEELPMYYDYHKMCRRLSVAPVKADEIVERLRERGWKASRTHFTGLGLKTDAGVKDVEQALIEP